MEPTVTTRYGSVRGRWREGVAAFLGIPYAASPTGPLRFRAPAPPVAWDGIREADRFGATPPNPRYAPPFDVLLPEPDIPGDGWLTVNVWTPDPGGAGLPATRMHAAWLAFARSGDPGWPAFDASCPVMVFEAHGGEVQADPRGDERRIWALG